MDNRNVYDVNEPIKRYPVKCPDIPPYYQFDRNFLKPKTDKVHIDFSKQISPKRSSIGILKHHDSNHGRTTSFHNQVTKKKPNYKSLEFQQTFYDYKKVYSGLDKLHKKSDFCLNHFDRQIPRDDR